ncbi:MAG: hypothetical protein Q8P11_03695 [bacterium]|nr:hypothetical protein [bacterium]
MKGALKMKNQVISLILIGLLNACGGQVPVTPIVSATPNAPIMLELKPLATSPTADPRNAITAADFADLVSSVAELTNTVNLLTSSHNKSVRELSSLTGEINTVQQEIANLKNFPVQDQQTNDRLVSLGNILSILEDKLLTLKDEVRTQQQNSVPLSLAQQLIDRATTPAPITPDLLTQTLSWDEGFPKVQVKLEQKATILNEQRDYGYPVASLSFTTDPDFKGMVDLQGFMLRSSVQMLAQSTGYAYPYTIEFRQGYNMGPDLALVSGYDGNYRIAQDLLVSRTNPIKIEVFMYPSEGSANANEARLTVYKIPVEKVYDDSWVNGSQESLTYQITHPVAN